MYSLVYGGALRSTAFVLVVLGETEVPVFDLSGRGRISMSSAGDVIERGMTETLSADGG